MGLTGVVAQATLASEPLASPWLTADVDRTDGLEHTLELMSEPERHRYSVAWLDLLASGSKLGRGIVSRADPFAPERVPRRARAARMVPRRRGWQGHALSSASAFNVPRRFPAALLRPSGARAFNAFRWRACARHERGRELALAAYLFPLDGPASGTGCTARPD